MTKIETAEVTRLGAEYAALRAKVVQLSPPEQRVQLLKRHLPFKKFGRDLMIAESDLKLVAEDKPGRPRKDAKAKVAQSETAMLLLSP